MAAPEADSNSSLLRPDKIQGAMAQWFVIAAALMLTAAAGCASSQGLDREAMRAAIGHDGTSVAERQLTAAEPGKLALSAPIRLALYFVENDVPLNLNIQKPEWTSADKEVLADGLVPLRREGIVADTFLLTDGTIRGSDVRKIRIAAARYGADAVLIVKGVGAFDRSNNAYAAWYVTVIGAYIVSGTVGEALFLIEGDVWDTRGERLYSTSMVEGHGRMVASAVNLEDRAVLALAKKSALEDLARKVAEEFIRLKDGKTSSRSRLR